MKELQTLQAANLPLAEQAALFARTTLLIGAHGAGLTNMLAMPDGGAPRALAATARLAPTAVAADDDLSGRSTKWWSAIKAAAREQLAAEAKQAAESA